MSTKKKIKEPPINFMVIKEFPRDIEYKKRKYIPLQELKMRCQKLIDMIYWEFGKPPSETFVTTKMLFKGVNKDIYLQVICYYIPNHIESFDFAKKLKSRYFGEKRKETK